MRSQAELEHDARQVRLQRLTRELAELSPIASGSLRTEQQITTEIAELRAAEKRYAGRHHTAHRVVGEVTATAGSIPE